MRYKYSKMMLVELMLLGSYCAAFAHLSCPHCYRVANVELTYDDTSKVTGLVQVYYGDLIREIYPGDNLLQAFDSQKKDIIFAPHCYFIDGAKGLGRQGIRKYVIREEIKLIRIENVQRLIFKSWEENFGGAGKIFSIVRKDFEKLHQYPIQKILVKINSVHDDIYVNLNPAVSDSLLELYHKYSPDELNRLFSFDLITEERLRNSFMRKEMIEACHEQSSSLTLEIAQLSKVKVDQPFRAYLNAVVTIIRERVSIDEAIEHFLRERSDQKITFLINSNEREFQELASQSPQYRLNSPSSNLNTMSKITLLKILHGRSKECLFEPYNQALTGSNVLLFMYGWD